MILGALALFAGAAGTSCASTGQVAPRTLTIEVATDPSGSRPLHLAIVPMAGEWLNPRGDPILLGTVPPGDVAQFDFETDRLGRYRLLATELPPPTTRGEIEAATRAAGTMRQGLSSRLGPLNWSPTIWINERTELVAWDIGTDALRVMEDDPAG